jgi:hypothetical protein
VLGGVGGEKTAFDQFWSYAAVSCFKISSFGHFHNIRLGFAVPAICLSFSSVRSLRLGGRTFSCTRDGLVGWRAGKGLVS